MRKKLFEFLIELACQGLIVHEHQRRLLHPLDDIGHGEGLAGPGDTEQGLMLLPGQDSGRQLLNGLSLITAGGEWSFEFERRHNE